MKVSFNTQFANHVELGIAPPMSHTSTIPVKVENDDGTRTEGIILYIGHGVFGRNITEEQFKEIVAEVVKRLQ